MTEQLYGTETQKAIDNFPISGERVPLPVRLLLALPVRPLPVRAPGWLRPWLWPCCSVVSLRLVQRGRRWRWEQRRRL